MALMTRYHNNFCKIVNGDLVNIHSRSLLTYWCMLFNICWSVVFGVNSYDLLCLSTATMGIKQKTISVLDKLKVLWKHYSKSETTWFITKRVVNIISFQREKVAWGKIKQGQNRNAHCYKSWWLWETPPLVVGESAKPQCFKNVKNLPCVYKSQAHAWMTDFFVTWL